MIALGNLIITVRISWAVLLVATIWQTVAYIISQRRQAKFERDHLANLEATWQRQAAALNAIRDTPDDDE